MGHPAATRSHVCTVTSGCPCLWVSGDSECSLADSWGEQGRPCFLHGISWVVPAATSLQTLAPQLKLASSSPLASSLSRPPSVLTPVCSLQPAVEPLDRAPAIGVHLVRGRGRGRAGCNRACEVGSWRLVRASVHWFGEGPGKPRLLWTGCCHRTRHPVFGSHLF